MNGTSEFLNDVSKVRAQDGGKYLALLAMMLFMAATDGEDAPYIRRQLQSAPHDDLEQAIKRLQDVRSGFKWPELIDGTVSFIQQLLIKTD